MTPDKWPFLFYIMGSICFLIGSLLSIARMP
jgi:hypothetical protein